MAFKRKNLSVLAYANGFTLWHYRTDEGDDPRAPRYWDDAMESVRLHDVILAPPRGCFMVAKVENGKVEVEDWPDPLAGLPPIPDFDADEDFGMMAKFGGSNPDPFA